jgi:hypothetical protein
MVRKTDSPKKRMAQLLYHGYRTKPQPAFAEFVAKYCEPPKDFYSALSGLDENSPDDSGKMSPDDLWNVLARKALSLGDDVIDREIHRAFEYFKLDPRNPYSWRLLVAYFSHVEFAEKRKGTPGAKAKWTGATLLELRNEIKKRKLGNVPAATVATKLMKDKTSSFYGRGKESLRQMIGLLRRA